MILAVDVQYSGAQAVVAGVAFRNWLDAAAEGEVVSYLEVPAPYQSGQFYRRELPCILRLLEEHALQPDIIVIDGFVFLDGYRRAGLGKWLYDALAGEVPVIGVAKNPFKGIGTEFEILRGRSNKALYVTAVGVELDLAKEWIRSMHGDDRTPTLLKRVDRMCRDGMTENH